jgi:hypothetical protein
MRTVCSLVLLLFTLPVLAQTDDRYMAVTFLCNTVEVDALSQVRFTQDADAVLYSIRIYGLDGLLPVLYLQTGREDDVEPCLESQPAADTVITLADETIRADIQMAALDFDSTADLGALTLTFGARPDTHGRYLALIDGFTVDPATDRDTVYVRNAPLPARDFGLLAYMIKSDPLARLDPFIESDDVYTCDDAGRRGCESVPPVIGIGVESALTVIGQRFDAGYAIHADDLASYRLELGSRDGRTTGRYALMLIGEY